jgi:hypothetical protein
MTMGGNTASNYSSKRTSILGWSQSSVYNRIIRKALSKRKVFYEEKLGFSSKEQKGVLMSLRGNLK